MMHGQKNIKTVGSVFEGRIINGKEKTRN